MKSPLLRTALLMAVLSFATRPPAFAAISNVQVLPGGRTNLSGEGTLVEAYNLGTTTPVTVNGVGTFAGDTGTDGVAGSAALATLSGGALNTADIGSAIDNLFFTETWNNGGAGMKMTYSLPDTGEFLVEILHGEPRSCCTGRFSSVTFSDANGTVNVPEFVIGNGIANQNPPPDADWAIIRAHVQGVTQFIYNMPNGTGRGSSIVGFQVRRLDYTPTDTELFISEISAAGNTAYKDENGDTPDWIEIYNPTNAAVDLTGWHLTNTQAQPNLWTFPAVNLPRGTSLVVFASGKNRAVAGARLHTVFKLPAAGGYLALTKPDGSVAHALASYPAQTDGFGYGLNGLARTAPATFFYPATPGGANGIGLTQPLLAPVFSVKKAVFTTSQTVTLSTTAANGQIRYTTDGTIPSATSTLYNNGTPLNFSASTRLRARVFDAVTGGGGEVDTGFYTKIETTSNLSGIAAPAAFNTNLPVLILDNFAAGGVPGTSQPLQFMELAVFEPDSLTGRTTLNRTPDKAVRAGLRIRGASSSGFAKKQYKLETWNEANGDNDEPLLGLPPESDWVLSAPYSDESLLRNPLVFGLGKDFGIPAPGTRCRQLFLNTDGGAITSADYAGVYILTESIKIGKNRLDLTNVNDFPDNDGGYLLRHEANVANETRITGWNYTEVHDPLPTATQTTYISNWVNGFNSALRTPGFSDPVNGFRKWADAGSFARMAALTEFVRAQDGYVRSAYFYKDRGQPLQAGPLWDYDLSFGVSCCFSTHLTGMDPATGSGWQFNHAYNRGSREHGLSDNAHSAVMPRLDWTRLMMQDPDFKQLFTDTWGTLRRGVLSTAGFNARVDALAAQVSDNGAADSPQKRNFIKWSTLGSMTTSFQAFLPANLTNASETWAGHVQYVKDWAAARAAFMDTQFLTPPVPGTPAGEIPAGTAVTLTSINTIYATLDGTDPRQPGGILLATATVLPPGNPAPSLTINATTNVVARARDAGGQWSAPLDLWYLTGKAATSASLIVSELHYHPAPPTAAEQRPDNSLTDEDFEFIELKNISAVTLDLSSAAFTEGIAYTFPSGVTLAPGATLVLAANATAFSNRYGGDVPVRGEYGGHFDNDGEHVRMAYPTFGAAVLDFTYHDSWHPPADGTGYSLVARDQNAVANASLAASWAISAETGGSPGVSAPGYSLTYESWLHYHFTAAEQAGPGLAGALDDPDRDTLSNLMEYALGTDPRSFTPDSALPHAAKITVGPDEFLTLTWTRPTGVLDLAYAPAYSFDLTGWASGGVATGPAIPAGSGKESVTYRSLVPTAAQARGFSRLSVTKP